MSRTTPIRRRLVVTAIVFGLVIALAVTAVVLSRESSNSQRDEAIEACRQAVLDQVTDRESAMFVDSPETEPRELNGGGWTMVGGVEVNGQGDAFLCTVELNDSGALVEPRLVFEDGRAP